VDGAVRFGVLGPLTASRGERPLPVGSPREQALLAVLLLSAGTAVPDAELLAAVWGDDPPPTGPRVLPPYVYRLRRHLGDPALLTRDGQGYRVEVSPTALDVTAYDRLVAAGSRACAAGDPDRAAAELGRAAALWRGEPLAGVPGPAVAAWRERVLARRDAAVRQRIRADLDRGRHADVVAELAALRGRAPADEELAELLVLALYRCGRQADALAVHAEVRRATGAEPGERLRWLQAAVLAADPALDPPAAAAPGPAGLPRAAGLVGREAELGGLLAAASGPGPRVVTVDGMAGVGKTALVLAVAHRLAPAHPDGALYVDLRAHTAGRSPAEPAEALDTLLRAAGVTGPLPADPDERAALWRATVRHRRLLVVLDNAAGAAQVEPLLPAGPGCLVLVASRSRLPGLRAAATLSLDVLPDAAAFRLLDRPDPPPVQRAAAAEVLRLCGGLPLALRLAAARLRRHEDWTLADLAARLRGEDGRPVDDGVRAAFSLSYEALPSRLQRAFRLLALVPGPDLDDHAAAALTGSTPEEAAATLEELLDANLLQQARPGRFQLHDLLREYATALVDRAAERAAAGRLLDYYLLGTLDATDDLTATAPLRAVVGEPAGLHRPRPDTTEDRLAWLDAEADGLVAAVVAAADDRPGRAWQLAVAVSPYLYLRSRLEDVREVNRAALVAAAREGDERAQATLWIHRGHLDAAAGRLDDAMAAYELARELKRRVGDARGELMVLNNLANVAGRAGRYGDGLARLREVLDRVDVEREPRAAGYAYISVAEAEHRLDRHAEAGEAARTACRLLTGDRDTPALTYTYALQGRALLGLDRPAEAVPVLTEALRRATDVGDRLNAATALTHLGAARLALGDAKAALAAHREAVGQAADSGLPEARQLAALGYADTLLALDRPAGAREHYELALRLHEDVREPAKRARALRGLSCCVRSAGAPEEAAALAAEADGIEARLHVGQLPATV
jgi:DNA-binding SARP family transcriptional activator/tetratricopeptide (TPR) repeat protein